MFRKKSCIPWFQNAVMGVPAATVPVSWRAPEVPSSLQASVVEVASVIGLLKKEGRDVRYLRGGDFK